MKIIKTCLINNEKFPIAEEYFVLELNNAGRGFITVQTDKTCTGQPVIFEVGTYDNYYKWFDGIVEREQSADNGYKKLFVREKVAIFEKTVKLFTSTYYIKRFM